MGTGLLGAPELAWPVKTGGRAWRGNLRGAAWPARVGREWCAGPGLGLGSVLCTLRHRGRSTSLAGPLLGMQRPRAQGHGLDTWAASPGCCDCSFPPLSNKPNPNQISVNSVKASVVNGTGAPGQSPGAGRACESCYSKCPAWHPLEWQGPRGRHCCRGATWSLGPLTWPGVACDGGAVAVVGVVGQAGSMQGVPLVGGGGGGRGGGHCGMLSAPLVLLKNPSISNFVVRSHTVLPVVFLGSP